MSRKDLLSLTPESVAALANLGLVKRAQREIAGGTGPSLEEDEAGVVTGTFPDGVVTKLPPNVLLRDAPCSCGATTVCRHRVAVVLAYPAWHESHSAPLSKKGEAWSPSCFDDAALEALVGKRLFRRAQTIARGGIVVEIEAGATPLAKLPTCTVRFHVPRDLAYARCDCQATIACEHVVIASWAFRRADETNTTAPAAIELGTQRTDAASAGLGDALTLAEHVIVEGIAHIGEGAHARFARARLALEQDGALWPNTILEDLERTIEAYRNRSARFRTADATMLLASLAARARAADQGGQLPRRYILGSDEAPETALDHVRLVSLGARIDADDRAREASVYLLDPDTGIVLVLSRRFEFAPDKDPEEGPDLAKRAIAGRFTIEAVARGQLVTRAAKRRANHALTLSASRAGLTSVAPSAGDWDSMRSSILVRDFGKLAEDLHARPPRLLAPRILASQMRVLALEQEAVQRVAYRPGEQEIFAELADTEGATVHLVRRHVRSAPHALDAIAKALADGPRFIAGDVRLGATGIEIDPTAIVTDRIVVPDIEKEKRTVEGLPLLAPKKTPALVAAIERASTLLEEALHDGLARTRSGFADRAAETAHLLEAIGLTDAALRVKTLATAVKTSDPEGARAWLDAAIRIELTREATLGVR